MTFAQPLWFWGFALFPVLLLLFLRNERARKKLLQQLVATRLAERLSGTLSVAKRRLRFGLLLLGLACVIVSAAQPRLGYTWQERKTRGRDVIIAIDVSRSMLANDLAPNRLTRAKLASEDLIGQLGGDRVGLVAFAGTAFLQAPLTADHSAVLGALHETDTDVIPRGGTNIAEAIRMAVEAFGKGESDNRALVIFTDGEELDADAVKVARDQKEISRIFTIGVGSAEGTVIAVPGRFGETDYVKGPDGQIVKSRLDEERLRAIAEAAGGFYLRLQNGPVEMRQLVREGISVMNEQESNAEVARQPIERYHWPLAAGLVLLIASMLVGERRRSAVRQGKAQLASVLLFLLPVFLAPVALADNPRDLYEQGKFKEAQQAYQELLQRNPNSDRLAFNHGAAAYRNRDFKAALESFGKALTTQDPSLRAKAEYNLGNTLFQQGMAGKKGPDIKTLEGALTHFNEARNLDPKDADAQHNYDVTQALIQKLKEQQQQQQQQQEDKEKKDDKQEKDQKDKEQKSGDKEQKDKQDAQEPKDGEQEQQKSGEKEEQEKGGKGKKDEKDSEEGKDGKQDKGGSGEEEEQQKQDSKAGKEQKEDRQKAEDAKSEQERNEGEQPDPSKPEEQPRKLDGELQDNPQAGEQPKEAQEEQQAAEDAAAAAEGRMTEAQAKALLDSLKSEDRNVRLWETERRQRERFLRDW